MISIKIQSKVMQFSRLASSQKALSTAWDFAHKNWLVNKLWELPRPNFRILRDDKVFTFGLLSKQLVRLMKFLSAMAKAGGGGGKVSMARSLSQLPHQQAAWKIQFSNTNWMVYFDKVAPC